MKIPDAYFSGGFGQTTARAVPLPGPGDSYSPIGEAGTRLGGSLLELGTSLTEQAGQQDLRAAVERRHEVTQQVADEERQRKETEHKLEQMNDIKQKGQAETALFQHENLLQHTAKFIAAEAAGTPAELMNQVRTAAESIKTDLMQPLDEKYQALLQPIFERNVLKTMDDVALLRSHALQQETIDATETAAVTLGRSPRPLGEKLILLNDLDWEKTGLKPAQISEIKRKYATEWTIDDVTSRTLAKQQRQVLDDLTRRYEDGTYQQYTDLDQKTRNSLIGHTADLIERDKMRAENEALKRDHLAEQARHNAFTALQTAVKDGYPLSPKLDIQARRTFAGTPYEVMYQGLVDQSNSVGHRMELINKDPLTYYARSKGVNLPLLDVSKPLTPQLTARLPLATAAQQELGLPFKPLLAQPEIKGISELMKKQDGPGRVQTGAMLGAMYGPQGATYIAAQLSGGLGDTKDGILGLTVGLAAIGKTNAATLVAHGADLLKNEKTIYDTTTKKQLADQFEKLAGSAWKGYRTETRDLYQQGVLSAYTARLKAAGADPAAFDNKLYQDAFQDVVGATGYINGKTTVLPDGWTEDTMKNSLKQLNAETVTRSGGVVSATTGIPLDPTEAAKRIRTQGSLWEAGDGTYYVQLDGAQLMSGTRNYKGEPLPFRLRFGGTPPPIPSPTPRQEKYSNAMDFGG